MSIMINIRIEMVGKSMSVIEERLTRIYSLLHARVTIWFRRQITTDGLSIMEKIFGAIITLCCS